MNSDPHEDPPEWCLTDDMRVLFNECIVKLQRGDPPGSWDVVVFRISELRDRLERAYSDVAGPAAARTI